jgi:tripartite-type tricarboxylate transporter receptor subunit TctC
MDVLGFCVKYAVSLARQYTPVSAGSLIRRVVVIAGALSFLLAAVPALAQGQSWPTRPIKLIVGYSPGGGADVAARLFSNSMSKILGQPIIVENRAGASGTLAAQYVVRAEPDGYTLLVAAISEISIAPATFKSLPYDPVTDFKSVVMFVKWPLLLVASPSFPPNTLAELIAYTKANPGKVNYSSFGINTGNHVTGERLKMVTGIDTLHVPYKGSGPSLTAVMSGEIQYTFDSPATTLNLINAGKLKGIAVAGRERLPNANTIPTMEEAGLPGFFASGWIGLLAPANTPKAIVDRLNGAALTALKEPELLAFLEKSNTQPGGGTPEEFGRLIHDEIAEYRSVALKIGIQPQ